MKRVMKKLLSTVFAVCMISSLLCIGTSAAERSSNFLNAYSASLTAKSGGKIIVTVDVSAIGSMSQLGTKDVYLYESKDGSNFSCIKTYSYLSYPAMMGSGLSFVKDVATYYGTAGYEYFAVVYVYAGNSTGGDTRSYTTSSVKAF